MNYVVVITCGAFRFKFPFNNEKKARDAFELLQQNAAAGGRRAYFRGVAFDGLNVDALELREGSSVTDTWRLRRCSCGASIEHRHRAAVYCESCASARRGRRAPGAVKRCPCGANISDRGNAAHWCPECAKAQRLRRQRQRRRLKNEAFSDR